MGLEVFKLPAATRPGYELSIASGNHNQTFRLDSAGSLRLAKPLDYETRREYKLVLLAATRRSTAAFDTMTVVVRVLDENDNPPFFPVSRQVHTVKEGNSAGSLVFVAHAVDPDTADTLTYSIVGDVTAEFAIGPVNGRVVAQRGFDYETEPEFNFQLVVEDSTGAKASADVTIKVNITFFIIDGCSFHYAHTWSKSGISIC